MNRSLLVVCVTATIVLAGCSGWAPDDPTATPSETDNSTATDGPTAPPDSDLEIHHLDVGQADATLFVAPGGETILVDSGDWHDGGEAVLDALASIGVDRIDHLVATHGHADHVGGHAAVIEHFETNAGGVGAVYDSGVAHTSGTYEDYISAVEDYNVTFYAVQAGDEFALETDGLSVSVVNPPAGDSGSDLHANSVSLAIEYGEFGYVTTGDAETAVESRLVDTYGEALAADAYQAGHHGSSTSSSGRFLDAVDPSVVVISSAADSQYGHPHDETLRALADRDVETYWTAVHGTVVLRTDGETYAVATDRDGPTDAAALLEEKREVGEDTGSLAHPSIDGPAVPTAHP